MSILGAGGLPALGLASSAAASQQRGAGLVDRDKADQEVQKLQADQVRLNNRDLDDSVETDFSHGQVSDRDSDGRLPWQHSGNSAPQEQPAEDDSPRPRAHDPLDEKGAALDVEA
jgi:hypothetical protein